MTMFLVIKVVFLLNVWIVGDSRNNLQGYNVYIFSACFILEENTEFTYYTDAVRTTQHTECYCSVNDCGGGKLVEIPPLDPRSHLHRPVARIQIRFSLCEYTRPMGGSKTARKSLTGGLPNGARTSMSPMTKMHSRPPILSAGLKVATKLIGQTAAMKLVMDNPAKVIRGEDF